MERTRLRVRDLLKLKKKTPKSNKKTQTKKVKDPDNIK